MTKRDDAQQLPRAGDEDGWHDERRSLSGLLTVVQRGMISDFHRRMDRAGYPDIRPGAGNVFEHIAPEGSTIVAMAERAGVSPQAILQTVDYLEGRGHVERTPDPTDRRAKLVRLTVRGQMMMETAQTILREMEAEFRRALGDERLLAFRAMLGTLAEATNASVDRETKPR